MSRLATPLALLLTLSTASLALAAAKASPAGPFDPPGISAHHVADAAAQRDRLHKLGLSKSWAPDLGPSDIDVLHYTMDLHIDIEREVLSGTVAMEVEAAVDNLSAVEVDADQGLRILGVMLAEDESFGYDGMRVLPFDHQHDRLSMQLPRALSRGERVTLLVSYGGHAGYYGGGVNWRDNGYGARVVYTFAEPFGSRLWWPCNDRPDDKATVDMSVTAPSWMVVSSNGLETGRVERADGSATTSWSSRYPVATYLVVMNASNYEVSELEYTRADGSTMPVVTYAYPGIADEAEQDLAITPDMITTLAARFGEYPFVEEKYGNCLTPFGGGMEHQTLTTISQNAIGGDWIDWLNVHELGHQWWGDWISPDDWRELWLNEGFATYSEVVWAEYVGPETLAQVVEDMDWRGYFLGAAYDNPVPFSSTVYEKGSWILRMLRHVLGDETFFAAVVDYRETFGGATATTEALQAIFEQHSGTDLDWFFQQWVYGENRPRYQYSWSEVAGPMVHLVVTQEHSNAPLFRMPMDVQITTTDGTEVTTVWLEAEAEQAFDIAVGHTPTEVVLDPDHQVLCELSPAGEPDLDLGPGYPGPFPGGTLLGGTSSMITIPLNNVGGSDLVIDSEDGPAIYPWNGNSYELVAPTEFPLTIAPGETEELQIRFTPAGVGTIGDRFGIESNDPSHDGFTLFEVQGTGVNSLDPFFSVPPIFLFGTVPVGGSAELVFNIANEGAEDLTLSSAMTSDDFIVATSLPEVLTPGQVVLMTVRFAPTEVGNRIGNLVFTTNDPLRPERTVLLRGTGTAAPRIAVDPPSVLFGLTEEPAATTVTVSNVGISDLEVAELTIDAPFQLADAPGLPMGLPPGESMTIDVQLGTAEAGTFRGTLRILSNDPSLPWATVPLKGQVVGSEVLYWAYPAVTSAEGLGGASWSTDTYFLNPTDAELALDLRFMAPGKRLVGPPDATATVPAYSQRTLADVVASMGLEGTGGLDVAVNASGLVPTSRTFAADENGTYGQFIAAVAEADTLTGGELHVLAGLLANEGFHTNFGVLNLGEDTISVDFEVHDPSGTSLGTITIAASAGAFAARTAAIGSLTDAAIRGAYAVATCADSSARYLAYASSVDDASHDPTFVEPQLLASDGPFDTVVPVVASNTGLGDTLWKSQLTVVNLGEAAATVEMEFRPEAGSEIATGTLELEPGQASYDDDIVATVLEAAGAGWLRLTSDNGDLYAASRTFNDNPDGTYGQNVTAIPAAEVFGADDTAVLAGVSSSDGFRTNVGITSLSPENTTYTLTAYAEDGTLIGELMVSVGANSMTQTIRVLGDLLDYTGRAWLTVSTDDPDAAFTTYASVVDGATGDSAYIPGIGTSSE